MPLQQIYLTLKVELGCVGAMLTVPRKMCKMTCKLLNKLAHHYCMCILSLLCMRHEIVWTSDWGL